MGSCMQLFYGHYPSLENQFLKQIAQQRSHPLDKCLVVCASSWMAQELKKRLAQQNGIFANIHFITTGGLISRLDNEAGLDERPLFPQDHLRDFLIKEILTEPGLDRYPVSDGFVKAVKSSLRDMADSLVDPDVFEEQVLSLPNEILEQEGDRLLWLIRVYRRYTQREYRIEGYRSYQQSFEKALEQVEKSAYLKAFQSIFWYGFYELSGRQLELFNQLKISYPITVFVAYQKHPAYQFAKKFFENNWLSNSNAEALSEEFPGALKESASCLFSSVGSAPCEGIKIVQAADLAGETFYTAKEILRLTQMHGYRFEDIAVVARTTVPYQDEIRRSFAENKIPLNASFSYPLTHYALGNFCLGLFGLLSCGFERNAVLNVVSSPYFKHSSKILWSSLIRRSLVSRDLSQWESLLPQTKNYDPSFLAWLHHIHNRLEALSSPAGWEKNSILALDLLRECVDETSLRGKELEIFETVCHAIEKMQVYGTIRKQCRANEFLREITAALSALSFNETEEAVGGVTFIDALRIRGLQFKAVFVLGVNDQSFPLVTPEDPVLRDYYRYLLRDVLGYWINQSLERGDEEKLLFYISLTSATDKLYVTHTRYKTDGKEAVPSVYLAELARACQIDLQHITRLSSDLAERLNETETVLLTPKEMSYKCIFDAEHPQQLLAQAGLLSLQQENSLTAAQNLRRWGELTAFDGIIESGSQLFEEQNKKGFSPSALQELAACPLKYFLDKGLQLSEEEELFNRQTLSADRKGNAYHEVLCEFYRTLYQKHLTHDLFDEGAAAYLEQALNKHYTPHSYRVLGIYPVVWEMILENIKQKLTTFVQEDLKQLGTFIPSRFEQPVSLEPTKELPLHLHGIIDRIDLDTVNKQFFVVDYKSSRKGTKDLAVDFFRFLIFQPFIYVFISLHLKELEEFSSAGSCLLSIQPKYDKRTLDTASFESLRQRACRFLLLITNQIKTGTFFICPSELCQFCSYSTLCRRDSFASLMRARKSRASHLLEEARQ
ncbi:MAG: exodeoxyribonuclease V subunit gamma [Elusimicrobiaceae bacterium]|nr:exodeoxyribonuclease V subunit gamma [Elusimicrobiaceae bacterium]